MVKTLRQGDKTTLTVTGTDRITVLNAGELKGELILNLSNSMAKKVYLDLQNIKFMDSTGISVLISGVKASRESGCGFVLKNLQDEVLRLLKLMKIDQIIDID